LQNTNIIMEMKVEEVPTPVMQQSNQSSNPPSQQQQVKLTELKVNSENDALNYMVGFLELAQRRGVFTLEEAAKINECVAKFRRPGPPPSQ
jgi:hypothetical protein